MAFLPEPFLGHLALLVHSIFCLIQDTLTGDDINMAKILLTEFVMKYNMLHGDINMVFNVHLLQHLSKDVFRWGLLWTRSAFCFKSYHGVSVKSIKGNRRVAMQVLHEAILKQSVNFCVLTKGMDVIKRSLAIFKDKKRCHSGDTVSSVTLLALHSRPSSVILLKIHRWRSCVPISSILTSSKKQRHCCSSSRRKVWHYSFDFFLHA
ncbi:uncharacterized protein LOC120844527 [Ixodes scapularis]|uniref:uncharacterized protein LOC120844527 n=1 Tax=Ixodes scapularis TaxID=6945 RepID=UPI001A9E00F3|nr:uncharacterized protein LOC120844527 [Ixodes scapularis]